MDPESTKRAWVSYHLGDVSCNDLCPVSNTKQDQTKTTHGAFSQYIERNVQPPREKLLARFGQVEPRNAAKLDTQALQEYRKDIRHEHNKEQPEPIRRTGRNVGRVVSGIDIGHGNLTGH